MALADERKPRNSHLISNIQTCSYYGIQKEDDSISFNHFPSPLSSPDLIMGINGVGFTSMGSSSSQEEAQSGLEFESGLHQWLCSSGSLLSFEQNGGVNQSSTQKISGAHEDDYSIWTDAMDHHSNSHWSHFKSKSVIDARITDSLDCFETATSYGAMAGDDFTEAGGTERCLYKRSHMGDELQASKKHCLEAARKSKSKPNPSKDPQSIAAKNRRERISERLKILQDLVPNGTKVDLVTMLEKAISYVKFLQLQVKVLATDEFWPESGGKAPEVAQVKEAIDAILSSQRVRTTSSN